MRRLSSLEKSFVVISRMLGSTWKETSHPLDLPPTSLYGAPQLQWFQDLTDFYSKMSPRETLETRIQLETEITSRKGRKGQEERCQSASRSYL